MEIILKLATRTALRITPKIVHFRPFMMSSARLEKELEPLKTNPYYEKYAKKIATLQQTSPEEFLARLDEAKKSKEKKSSQNTERQYTSLLEPKKDLSKEVEPVDEPLDKIMKLDLIKDKSPEEICNIWREYHIQKDVIAATIQAKDYDEMNVYAKQYPIFLFPIPRSQGFEFIMAQFQRNMVHFTPLICYQVHKENAPECLTITYYSELKESKGIVLMRGEFDKNVINVQEAQCLANQLQMYYGGKSELKLKLLKCFNEKPDEFKHMDLIKEIENLSIT